MALNVPPPPSSFCVEPPKAPEGAGVIRVYGGFTLQGTGDATKGPQGACAVSQQLMGMLQGAMAPLGPIFTIMDVVSSLAQCFLLLVDVVKNPLKLPKLLGLIPGLVGKINKLLALVPPFPQGFLSIAEMVLDTLNFVLVQLECLLQILKTIDATFDELRSLTDEMAATDDSDVREALSVLVECGMKNAKEQTATALSAFGPLARIICFVRALIALVPGGAPIARKIGLPDSTAVDLDGVISVIQSAHDLVEGLVAIIAKLGEPIGLALPETTFKCPPLPPEEEVPAEPPPEPRVDRVIDALSGAVVAALPNSIVAPVDFAPLALVGEGFTPASRVFFETAEVLDPVLLDPSGGPLPRYQFVGHQRMDVALPANLFSGAGVFHFVVVNVAADVDKPFSGASETAGGAPMGDTKTSNAFPFEVT